MPRPKTPLTRSQQMSRIHGRDTSPELVVRRGLWAAGIRYRLQQRTSAGRADLVIAAKRLVLFIDGCFWHGCPEHYVRPRSRNEFWDAKLVENVKRDRQQTLTLESQGWRVLRVWEHEISESPVAVLNRLLSCIGTQLEESQPDWRVVRVTWLDESSNLELRHLEDLRNPERRRSEMGRRSTRKVGRVSRRIAIPDENLAKRDR